MKYVKVYLSKEKDDIELGFGFYIYGVVQHIKYTFVNNDFTKEFLTVRPIKYTPTRIDYYRDISQVFITGEYKEKKYKILKAK